MKKYLYLAFMVILLLFTMGCQSKIYQDENLSKSQAIDAAQGKGSERMVFPNDDDGNPLRMLYQRGIDFSIPQNVDFFVVTDKKSDIESIKTILTEKGFSCKLVPEGGKWTCYSSKKMMLEYNGIVEMQKTLNSIAKPYGGYSDGWGVLSK